MRHVRGIYHKVFHRVAWKFLKWGISHQPLIRKHSYLDHRYPGGSAFIPWLLTPGSILKGEARGQKLGHFWKVFFFFFFFFFLLFRYGNNVCRQFVRHGSILRHWLVGHEVKVSMSYILRSSDFVLYIEDYLMYVHHTLGVWISMNQYDPTFDLKINVGHCDL